MKEEIYKQFCKDFRAKIKEITDPVSATGSNRSYNALVDVVTNIILLEINMDRMPFDQIPKREVHITKSGEVANTILNLMNDKEIAKKLLKIIEPKVSYRDSNASSFDDETVKTYGLYASLKMYLK